MGCTCQPVAVVWAEHWTVWGVCVWAGGVLLYPVEWCLNLLTLLTAGLWSVHVKIGGGGKYFFDTVFIVAGNRAILM